MEFLFVEKVTEEDGVSYGLHGIKDADVVYTTLLNPNYTLVGVSNRELTEHQLKQYRTFLKKIHSEGSL